MIYTVGELPPKPFKPRRIGRRVNDGVPDVAVSEMVMNEPRVRALIGQLAVIADLKPCGLAAQSAAPLADKESVCLRLHLRADRQPCLDKFDLVGA